MASLVSNFRSVLPELNHLAALATQLLTEVAPCTMILTYLLGHSSLQHVTYCCLTSGLTKKSQLQRCTPVGLPRAGPTTNTRIVPGRVSRPGCTTEQSDQYLWEGSQPRLGTTVGATHSYTN